MPFSAQKQVVKPPQRGIFPLDHEAECRDAMKTYLDCLTEKDNNHYECRAYSKKYLQCRMDNQLMAKEDLDEMGFSNNNNIQQIVEGRTKIESLEGEKEEKGFVAGKHIQRRRKWFWES